MHVQISPNRKPILVLGLLQLRNHNAKLGSFQRRAKRVETDLERILDEEWSRVLIFCRSEKRRLRGKQYLIRISL